ncbi:hypothetical protein ABPG75_001685 [Micractinium tetrahymenae]
MRRPCLVNPWNNQPARVPAPPAAEAPAPPPSPEVLQVHAAIAAGDLPALQAAVEALQHPERELDVLVKLEGDATALAPLHRAAVGGRETCLKFLLISGADRDLPDSAGRTPFFCAAEAGQEECLEVLLSGGCIRTAANAAGRTAVHAAAAGAHERCLWQLINARVPVNARDGDGATPLHLAAAAGSVPCLRALLSAGAAPLAVCSRRARTPRQVAAAGDHAAAVLYLTAVESTAQAAPGRPTRAELLAEQGELAGIYKLACRAQKAAPGGEAAQQALDALKQEVMALVERQGTAHLFKEEPNHI